MTEEEKAVAIFELRERGMHPEWIRWFVWHAGGRCLQQLAKDHMALDPWFTPPDRDNKNTMRRRGFNPDG